MRYTITISIEAEQDLSCIYKSIVVNNEVLAKRVLDEFYEKIKSLEFFPYRNPKLLKKHKIEENVRVTYLYRYFILYEIDDLKNVVNIYRIVYCGKDVRRLNFK